MVKTIKNHRVHRDHRERFYLNEGDIEMSMDAVVKRSSYSTIICLIVILFLLAGCASSLTPYVSRDFEAGKMAILPFDNLSESQGAAKTMENFVLIEFLKRSSLGIVEPGQVMAAISQARVRLATSIPKETVIQLGQDLEVDLFMIGVVHEYKMQRLTGAGGSGEIPVVSLSLRIIDSKTGNVVWAVNSNRRGNDRESVFGVGRVQSLNELAGHIAMELAQVWSSSF